MRLRNGNKNIYIEKTKDKGKTYFAARNFKKGEVVYSFTGKIVSKPTRYTVPIGRGLFINPTKYGGKYTNDYGKKANLGIKNRTKLVAMRNIQKGEEVGPAYFMFVPFYKKDSIADKLSLTSFNKLSENDKRKFRKYISDYLFKKNEIQMYIEFIKK